MALVLFLEEQFQIHVEDEEETIIPIETVGIVLRGSERLPG